MPVLVRKVQVELELEVEMSVDLVLVVRTGLAWQHSREDSIGLYLQQWRAKVHWII